MAGSVSTDVRHYHVDRIITLERGRRAVGVRSVALSDDVFADHFPGNPVLPGVYVVEGLAQTAGILLWETTNRARVAVMTTVDRARFSSFARPGDLLQLAVELEALEQSAAIVRGEATAGNRRISTARLTFSLQDPEQLIPAPFQPFWHHMMSVWCRQEDSHENA
jgi:3-hydroxyacyl-[acyl-carrier-protein] dehydratase